MALGSPLHLRSTTPEDVFICEAYLAFLHSGNMGDFWCGRSVDGGPGGWVGWGRPFLSYWSACQGNRRPAC